MNRPTDRRKSRENLNSEKYSRCEKLTVRRIIEVAFEKPFVLNKNNPDAVIIQIMQIPLNTAKFIL